MEIFYGEKNIFAIVLRHLQPFCCPNRMDISGFNLFMLMLKLIWCSSFRPQASKPAATACWRTECPTGLCQVNCSFLCLVLIAACNAITLVACCHTPLLKYFYLWLLLDLLFLSYFTKYQLCFYYFHLQEDKVVQMYETMMTRHSTMIVGPTGGGKTVVINTLIKAQTHMGLPTKCITLNPKVSSHSFDCPNGNCWASSAMAAAAVIVILVVIVFCLQQCFL